MLYPILKMHSNELILHGKLTYAHKLNLISRKGLVYRPEDYVYSSASNYAGIDQVIDVDCLYF